MGISKFLLCAGIFSGLCFETAAGGSDGETARSQAEPEVGVSVDQFAWDLFQALSGDGENVIISPYNISSALVFAAAGAHGDTLQEMKEVLHLPESDDWISPWAALDASLAEAGRTGPTQLDSAASLWVEEQMPLAESYLQRVREQLGGAVEEVDFMGAPEQARLKINEWVEKNTGDNIKDLLSPGDVDADTRLLIATAIYFLGDWMFPFQEAATQEKPFHLHDGSKVDVPTMTGKERFGYHAAGGWEVLEMPYVGGRFGMVVLLPGEETDLDSLNPEEANGWLNELNPRQVEVHLPKFKFQKKLRLDSVLRELGMKEAFIPDQADFSGIAGTRDLYIGLVLHEAMVDVNEKGTEAAAATAVGIRATSLPPPEDPVVFRADRPFYFAIRDRETGVILFLGQLANPTSE